MAEVQEILDEPQVDDAPAPDEGPGPKSALSEENRKKLDSIVGQMIGNKESEDNIRTVIEDFKKKYTSAQLPSVDYRKPVQQTRAVESTGVPQNVPREVPRETTKDQLLNKYKNAREILHTELTQNNDLIPGLIKDQKEQAGRQDRLNQMGMHPQSDQPRTSVQQLAQQLQPNTPEPVSVSDEEVQDYATLAQKDQSAGRAFLQHVADKKPERAKTIQQATYLHDAIQRIGDERNGEQKMGKVLLNAKKIDKGELRYNPQNGMLTKPEGVWQSISTGLQEKNKAFSDYDIFKNGTPQQSIQELEKRRNEHDPDEPIPVPEGMLSHLAGGIAGQPLKGLVAGKIAGAGTALIPGGGEFAPAADKFVSAALSSNDFRKMSYARVLQTTYNKLRNEGLSPEDAYHKANGQAKDESMVDAVAGGAMMYGAGMIGELKLPKFSLSQGFTSAVKNGLKQAAKGIGEAGAVGLIQGEGEHVKNELADMKGIDRRGDITEAIKSGTLFTLGMALLAKGGSSLVGKTKSDLLQGLSKATPEQIDAELGNQILEQHITPDEAGNVKKMIDEHREMDKSIPDNITEESRGKIQQAIKRRRLLEIQLESEDAAFHPETKEKIKKINEDILELSKDKIPRGELDENKIAGPEPTSEEPTEGVGQPETETATPSISTGDTIISDHLDGPQSVRSVSEDGKTIFVEGLADHHVHEIPIEEVALKVKKNSSVTRDNQEQIAKETETPQGVEGINIDNKKVSETEAPANAETTQPEVDDPGMTGISHARTDEAARQFGLDTYETKPETVAQWDEEADKRIKSDPQAIPKLLNKLKNDEQPDKIEQRMMMRYMASLKARIEEMPTPELIAKYKEAKTLSDIMGGREVGKSLAARRGSTPTVDSLADYLTEDMESAQVDELTPKQIQKNTVEYNEIKQKQAAYEKKIADLEEENTKLRAEGEIKKTSASKKGIKKTREEFVKERKSIIEDMRADLLKAAKGDGGLASSVPGAAQLKAIAPHVVKLVKSLVEEGVDKLEDVVKSIHGDIKDVIEGISEKDIHDIIAGEYNEKRATKSESATKLRKLKEEAALINKLERIQNGEEPNNEKKKVENNKEIAVIKKEIAKIQKENNPEETIEPQDIDLKKLESIKKRNENQTQDIQEKIKKGDFGPDQKKTPWYEDEELRKKYPEQFESAIKATDEYISSQKQRATRLAKQQYENRSGRQKMWDWVKQILGLRRAINTAFDFSVPFRQASRVTMNPLQAKTTAKAFKTMFSHTFSPKAFDRWFFNLEKAPDYLNMQKDGLYISSPDELRLSKREEQFQSDLAGKIPLLKEPFNASQRAASAYLNQMRVDLYRSGSKLLNDKGIKREDNPKAYESLAKLANNLTGRGNLMEWLEGKPASALSQIFYGPRLMASKFNLLNPLFYAKMPKPIRRQVLANMAGYVGFYTSVGLLANAAGASVTLDPNDPDFLKIKVGDTKYDITGGEAVYVRTFLRVLGAAYDRINGSKEEQTKSVNKASSSVLSFFRNKLAPNTSYALNAFLAKNSVGQPFNPTEALKYYPMWIDDMVDDWNQDGAASILTAAIPSIFGLGVQTYVPKQSSGGSGGGSGAGGNFEIKEWK